MYKEKALSVTQCQHNFFAKDTYIHNEPMPPLADLPTLDNNYIHVFKFTRSYHENGHIAIYRYMYMYTSEEI